MSDASPSTSSAASDRLEVLNPLDGSVIGNITLFDWDQINSYLDRADALFRDRQQHLPKYQRIEILRKTARIMEERAEELAVLIATEGGKPLVDARVEVARAIDGVGLCASELEHLTGHEVPMDLTQAGAGHISFSTREPIGPVVALSAFNHPLNLIVHQVAPAVAVGCPVLVKPAGDTPLSCQAFVNILIEAGLPAEWCRFAPCDIPAAERMVTDPRVAFFSFIGSAKVGWMLRSKLAPGTRCALEHGGVAPVIIDDDVPIESIVPSLIKGGFYHSGQVCVSVQRIFASTQSAAALAAALAQSAQALSVGDATLETTDCGPLIRPAEVERVDEWVKEAVLAGAQLMTGGKKISNTLYAPTVLLDPPETVRVSTQEIFGPVVCVYSSDTLDSSIARANALPFAFQASVFSNRLDVAMRAVQELDAAAVMVNDHSAFRVDWMPFAGRRQSGYGVGGIGHTMRDMTQEKLAVIKI